ncbi:MAG: hydroxyethylthiazole kinase [Thermanaerothrix sp.]|nr:hydroxyethylthiazole kinase [Thermanaerothrix sp.]
MDGNELRGIALEVARRSPLVHHVTNRVASALQAKACYALKGRAIMTDLPAELPEASAMAQSGLINLGTPAEHSERAYQLAAKLFKGQRKPFLLDPVGCSSFEGRLRVGLSLCHSGPQVVKGNYGEVLALACGRVWEPSGVDAAQGRMDAQEALKLALELSNRFRCCVAATGEADVVAFDGRGAVISGGSPMGAAVPGLGCALGSVMVCAMGANVEPYRAAVWGCALFKAAAQWAQWTAPASGPEGFLKHVLDFLFLCHHGAGEGSEVESALERLEVVEC